MWAEHAECKSVRSILSHRDIFQPMLQDLQELFWKLHALRPISKRVFEDVTDGDDRVGYGARQT